MKENSLWNPIFRGKNTRKNTSFKKCICTQFFYFSSFRTLPKYVANKDMKAFAKDLKTIYMASDEPAALKQLDAVTDKWAPMYPSAMNRWHENWDAISPIFKFSKEVRTAFYTTNAIESLNSSYRRLNKQRSVFPSPHALLKSLFISTNEITKKWTMPIRNWELVRGKLVIMYPGRMPD